MPRRSTAYHSSSSWRRMVILPSTKMDLFLLMHSPMGGSTREYVLLPNFPFGCRTTLGNNHFYFFFFLFLPPPRKVYPRALSWSFPFFNPPTKKKKMRINTINQGFSTLSFFFSCLIKKIFSISW